MKMLLRETRSLVTSLEGANAKYKEETANSKCESMKGGESS